MVLYYWLEDQWQLSPRYSPEVVVSVAGIDVLVVALSVRHVTRALPTTTVEHRRLDVEVTPSTNQLGNGIAESAHPGLTTSAERSPRRSMFGQGWQRLFAGGRRWRFFATGQIHPTDPRSALGCWRTFVRTSPKDGDRRENRESHLPIGLLAAGENAFGSYTDSGADPIDSANSPQKRASLCNGNCSLRSYTTGFLALPLVSD